MKSAVALCVCARVLAYGCASVCVCVFALTCMLAFPYVDARECGINSCM